VRSFLFRAALALAVLLIISGALAGILTFSAGRDQPVIRAELSPRRIYVGDPAVYSISVITSGDTVPVFPGEDNFTDGPVLLNSSVSEVDLFLRRSYRKKYVLTAYKAGDYTVSEMEVKYGNASEEETESLKLPPVGLKVESVLPEDISYELARIKTGYGMSGEMGSLDRGDEAGSISEIEGPVRFRIKEEMYLVYPSGKRELWIKAAIFAGSGVVVTFLILVIHFIRRKVSREKISPSEKASADIRGIAAAFSSGALSAKQYCALLHGIFVRYIKQEHALGEKEMLFPEFRERILDTESIDYEQKKFILDVVKSCEDIRYLPEEPRCLPAVLDAQRLLDFIASENGEN
jgi:hypothetical protein